MMLKVLNNKNCSLKSTALFLTFLLFGLYPLIPEKAESYVPIFLLVTSFWFFITSTNKKLNYSKAFLISSSIFFVFLISCLWSYDLKMAFKKIETMLSLIGIPISFFLFLNNQEIDYKKLETFFLKIFFASNIFYSVIALFQISTYTHKKYPIKDANFFRNALSDIPLIGEHPIYVSLFIAIAIISGTFLYINTRKYSLNNLIIAFGHVILITLLIVLMSKAIIFGLIVSFSVLFATRFKRFRIVFLIGIIVFASALFFMPKQNNRFKELFSKQSYDIVNKMNSTNIRYNILKCNIDLVSKSPVFGYGLGDVQLELDNCFEANKFNLIKGKFNSHNQYLFVWLSSGIFGLIIFLALILFYFKIALFYKDYLMLSFIILFSILFLFENTLSRQTGVILFSFIMSFMLVKNLKSVKSLA